MTDVLSIDKGSLQAKAYAVLRRALMTGRFQPGQKLLLRPLADELGISVTPVREALLQLVSEHALISDSSRSLAVPALDLERFVEIRDLRIELEGRAAEAAARTATPADIAELRALQHGLAAARRTGDFPQALGANELFHFTVYRLARMPVLYRIIEGLWVQIGPILTRLYNQAGTGSADRQHPHDLMILALERKDGTAARHAVATDIMWASRHLEPTLEHEIPGEAIATHHATPA